jgi:hypothetical protein
MTKPRKYWEQVIRLMESEGYSNMADELHLQMHDIHNKALKDAADRAVLCWFESDPHEDPLNIAKRLRAAIYAGEVKE